MKISRYTFLFPFEKDYYIYNTLSNSLICIDESSYHQLKNHQQKGSIEKLDIDLELYELLKDKSFITENEKDDFLIYKSIIEGQRSGRRHMHLTIAPTMDCNFSCHYCFEKKEKSYITSEVIDSIIKHVTRNEDLEELSLTWFGGEPLMAVDKIEEFTTKFTKVWDKKFTVNIITTAYHITPEVIKVLKKASVTSMQITLDGNRETHNRVKNCEGCDDAFSKVISNIDLLTQLAPEIHIIIRVNLTKQNMYEYEEIYAYLSQRYKGKKLGISPGIVNDRGEGATCEDCADSIFMNKKECSEFLLGLFNEKGIHTPFITYPKRFFTECAIRNKTSIGVGPDGYVYKCWEVIGNKKHAIGRLVDGEIQDINYTVLNRQLYGADPIEDKACSRCSYLPLCNGGCPIQRIENEFEEKNNDMCTFYKGYLPEFMKIHLLLKKAGYSNY